MSRFLQRLGEEPEDHDVSKELFLGIMMLMLCLGILILNVALPVWRVHHNEPRQGDVVLVYRADGFGLTRDGYSIEKKLNEWEFRRQIDQLVGRPGIDVHFYLRGGSRETLLRHMAYADSLLSAGVGGEKVRPAVFWHGW